MVNVGGPSRGCMTCIQRKIRCDRQRPVCGQCQKSARHCGGYRNETDIMFRDQSQTVSARVLAASQSQASVTETPSLGLSDHPRGNVVKHMPSSESGTPRMTRSPRLNAENGLITFFTNNFACGSSNRGSNLFWLPTNFDDLLKDDSAKFSVQSVGAMALARLQRSNYYYREAQKYYGLALLSLAEMWRQHLEVEKDAVLIAITCLGFFEILASYDSYSRKSWTTHLGGLGLLLKKRDEQFFATDFGARMLLQSRSQVILNALQTKTPIPEVFRVPNQRVHRSMPPQLILPSTADMLLIRLATLQAQYQSSGPSDALIAQLTALDDELCQWTESIPQSWLFSPQPSRIDYPFWWEARCDVYPLGIISHVWNKIRAARIVTHDLIQEISSRLSSLDDDILKLAIHKTSHDIPGPEVRRLVTDICATVPIYYRPSSASARTSDVENKPLLGPAFWLLWVLEVVGSMREAPSDLRKWVLMCLERIYDTTGIVKAQVVADRVKIGQLTTVVA